MPTDDRSTGEPATFRCWLTSLLIVPVATFPLLSVMLLVISGSNAARACALIAGALGVFLMWRLFLSARVRIGQDGVAVWNTFSSRLVPWAELRDAEVGFGTSLLLPWRVPVLVLVDGSFLLADGVRSLRKGTVVDDVVLAVKAHLKM
jgi:hypothetical protein